MEFLSLAIKTFSLVGYIPGVLMDVCLGHRGWCQQRVKSSARSECRQGDCNRNFKNGATENTAVLGGESAFLRHCRVDIFSCCLTYMLTPGAQNLSA